MPQSLYAYIFSDGRLYFISTLFEAIKRLKPKYTIHLYFYNLQSSNYSKFNNMYLEYKCII